MLAHDAAQCSSHQGLRGVDSGEARRVRGCKIILARRGAFGAARCRFWRVGALLGLRGVDSRSNRRFWRGKAPSGPLRGVDSGASARFRGCAVWILARRVAFSRQAQAARFHVFYVFKHEERKRENEAIFIVFGN